MRDTYTRCRDQIAALLDGPPPPSDAEIVWDHLTTRQRVMILRGVGLNLADCGGEWGFRFGMLTVGQRHRVMKLLAEWLGNFERLGALLAQVNGERLEQHRQQFAAHLELVADADAHSPLIRQPAPSRRERAA